jgi:hypothetical protein
MRLHALVSVPTVVLRYKVHGHLARRELSERSTICLETYESTRGKSVQLIPI